VPRYAKKKDQNQPEIEQGLTQREIFFWDTHAFGFGFPDLLVVFKGIIILFEVKMPGEKLTSAEKAFHKIFPGPLFIVHNLKETLQALEGV
jgi:hypothetical protein